MLILLFNTHILLILHNFCY